jgi:hypothetical protein
MHQHINPARHRHIIHPVSQHITVTNTPTTRKEVNMNASARHKYLNANITNQNTSTENSSGNQHNHGETLYQERIREKCKVFN